MMLHTLTARVFLMVMDHQVLVADAVAWVTRRLPGNMRAYYTRRVTAEFAAIGREL
jgi:hypothetical protein